MRGKFFIDYGMITIGSLVTALGLNMFTIPNRIAAGGASGLATIMFHVFGFPVGIAMLVINVPLFLASLKILGFRFGLKTAYGFIVLSLLVDLLEPFITSPTSDALLAAIFGGFMTGLGLGLTFRAGGTTGGTDIAAQLLRKFFGMSTGYGLFIVDGIVIVIAGIVFSVELALYALLAVFITARVIDLVQEGVGAKAALIITNESEAISKVIMSQLDRGATIIEGIGAYTWKERRILLTVVARSEVTRLKAIVSDEDPYAFVIVTNANEVVGEGFHQIE